MATQPRTEPVLRIAIEEFAEHLPRLEQELRSAGRIELLRGTEIIAEVRTVAHAEMSATFVSETRVLPDFAARLRAIWGNEEPSAGAGMKLLDEIRQDRDADW